MQDIGRTREKFVNKPEAYGLQTFQVIIFSYTIYILPDCSFLKLSISFEIFKPSSSCQQI